MGKVEQPFEHLTDAQIEHYGEEQAGAGPDQDQQLAAHLADCSGCRSRLLAFHRTRFTPGSRPRSTPSSMDNSSLTATHRPGCPAEENLRNLAAGLTPPDQAVPLIQHAAQCARCGPVLSMYTEDFSDDLSPDDEALLAQLKSASPEWQKRLVRDLQVANSDADAKPGASPAALRSRSTGKRPWLRWALVPATVAACAALAFFVWYQQRDTPEKVERLLAQSYTKKRTMEFRWPSARWSPVQVTRGATAPHLSQPSSLLEAEKILSQHRDPKNGDWLSVKAEAELLDGQTQKAITDLTHALEHNPSSIHLTHLLAIAYAYQGDVSEDRASRERAVDLLTTVLQREPDNTTALFNRALLYERLNMLGRAAVDWSALLMSEKDSAWAAEARRALDKLKASNL